MEAVTERPKVNTLAQRVDKLLSENAISGLRLPYQRRPGPDESRYVIGLLDNLTLTCAGPYYSVSQRFFTKRIRVPALRPTEGKGLEKGR